MKLFYLLAILISAWTQHSNATMIVFAPERDTESIVANAGKLLFPSNDKLYVLDVKSGFSLKNGKAETIGTAELCCSVKSDESSKKLLFDECIQAPLSLFQVEGRWTVQVSGGTFYKKSNGFTIALRPTVDLVSNTDALKITVWGIIGRGDFNYNDTSFVIKVQSRSAFQNNNGVSMLAFKVAEFLVRNE